MFSESTQQIERDIYTKVYREREKVIEEREREKERHIDTESFIQREKMMEERERGKGSGGKAAAFGLCNTQQTLLF